MKPGPAYVRRSLTGRAALRLSVTPAELETFYREFFLPLVRRATWTHGLEKEDARDIVQEAFVLALTKLDARRNPKAWLIQVVDHLSTNHNRKTARRARLTAKWTSGYADEAVPGGEPPETNSEVAE